MNFSSSTFNNNNLNITKVYYYLIFLFVGRKIYSSMFLFRQRQIHTSAFQGSKIVTSALFPNPATFLSEALAK